MKKISASQAKAAADAAAALHDSKTLEDIYKQIDAATKKGAVHIAYYGNVSLKVRDILIAQGYKLDNPGGRHDEDGVEINWNAPTN
jgi:hypothetical protein